MAKGPYILGGSATAQCRHRDGTGPRDWVRRVVGDALRDAGVEAKDIDAVVVAGESDFFSLQLAPGSVFTDDVGLVPAPVVRLESGGASGAAAVRAAYAQVISGLAERVLVIGVEHTASHLQGDNVRLLYGLSFDADLEGLAGVQAVNLYALSMQAHMAIHGTSEADMAYVSVKNHGNAKRNPLAHKPMDISIDDVLSSPPVSSPYKRLDCSLISDGAAALVLSSVRGAPTTQGPRVQITGTGAATDAVRLGDRVDYHRFNAKARAADLAYHMAGIRHPAEQIQVAEVYDAFTGAEIQGLEALGLIEEGRGARAMVDGYFDADGAIPANVSGGLIGQGGAPGATGIIQTLTVQQLLLGQYSAQTSGEDLRVGLVDTHGGVCTTSVVHVLERMDSP